MRLKTLHILLATALSVGAHVGVVLYAGRALPARASKTIEGDSILIALVPPQSTCLEIESDPVPELKPVSPVTPEPAPPAKPEPTPERLPQSRPETKSDPKPEPPPVPVTGDQVDKADSKLSVGQCEPRQQSVQLGRAVADYKAMVRVQIANARTYPLVARRLRLEGDVGVSFVIHANGSISRLEIVDSSGHKMLDRAAEKLIQRIAPLSKPPTEPFSVSFSLRYTLKNQER